MTDLRRATTFRLDIGALEWLKLEGLRRRTPMGTVVQELIDARRGALGMGGTDHPTGEVCPACRSASFYHRGMDRYVHTDGSDNRDCWRRLTEGATCACEGDCRDDIGLTDHQPCRGGMHMTWSYSSGTPCGRCQD